MKPQRIENSLKTKPKHEPAKLSSKRPPRHPDPRTVSLINVRELVVTLLFPCTNTELTNTNTFIKVVVQTGVILAANCYSSKNKTR